MRWSANPIDDHRTGLSSDAGARTESEPTVVAGPRLLAPRAPLAVQHSSHGRSAFDDVDRTPRPPQIGSSPSEPACGGSRVSVTVQGSRWSPMANSCTFSMGQHHMRDSFRNPGSRGTNAVARIRVYRPLNGYKRASGGGMGQVRVGRERRDFLAEFSQQPQTTIRRLRRTAELMERSSQ